jgi:hypothetical protein
MTSTLIASNTFNTSLGVGKSVSGDYVDMSAYISTRLWVYSDKNLQIQIIYATSSGGDSSVSELYSTYANQNVAINSTKKKTWQRTIVTNPTGSTHAERVVVKTRHSKRDPNPVLTYQTDDLTLQANINLEDFEANDVSTSSIQVWGSTTASSIGNYRIIQTDTCGRLLVTSQAGTTVNISSSAATTGVLIHGTNTGSDQIIGRVDASGRFSVVSTVANPVYVTASASESSIRVYGNDGTNNKLALTDSAGRFQVTTSAEQSTVQLYATSTGSNKIAVLVDASGRLPVVSTATNPVYVNLYDASGRALSSTNGALNVAIGDAVINVDISVQDNIVIHGKNSSSTATAVTVSDRGQVATTVGRNISSVQTLYSSATNVNADASTSTMDISLVSNQINIMGQSSKLCTLKVRTSPDSSNFYDSIYSFIIKNTGTNFKMSVPIYDRYVCLVPDVNTSLTLSYTY